MKLSLTRKAEGRILTIKWDTIIVLQCFLCVCLVFKVNICGSFAAAGPVIVDGRFL